MHQGNSQRDQKNAGGHHEYAHQYFIEYWIHCPGFKLLDTKSMEKNEQNQ